MLTKTLRRVVTEMRQQPVIASVTLIGTAFAVFLAMVVMMMAEVKTTPFAPESNRPRLYFGKFMHTASIEGDNNSSAMLSTEMARKLYSGLEGVDTVTFMTSRSEATDVKVIDRNYQLNHTLADAAFWTIFNHKFIAGRPYSEGAVESGIPEVVLSESTARTLYGTNAEDALGKTLIMGEKEATVVGVVADHSPLAKYAYGEIFGPYTAFPSLSIDYDQYHGNRYAVLLASPGTTTESLKSQLEQRYRRLEAELKPEGIRPVYHGYPYTLSEAVVSECSNCDVQSDGSSGRLFIYLMLILIPAINLSSITQSRLRRRTSEFGVRRAFGATRSRIFGNLIVESFFMTLAGSIIGLVASILVTWATADTLFHLSDFGANTNNFSPFMLINWNTVGFAILLAFVLNILSAGIPAIRAAFVNPVTAISGHSK